MKNINRYIFVEVRAPNRIKVDYKLHEHLSKDEYVITYYNQLCIHFVYLPKTGAAAPSDVPYTQSITFSMKLKILYVTKHTCLIQIRQNTPRN